MRLASLAVVLAISLVGHARAEDAPAPTTPAPTRLAHAKRLEHGLKIDGHLDEPEWREAVTLGDFTQRYPKDGVPSPSKTRFAIYYDDRAIYVGVWADDPEPDQIRALLTRRDLDSAADAVAVGIDSYHDRRTAYVFQLNAAGVQRDMLLFDDANVDDSWDAVWSGAAAITATGWTAEFCIPLSQLRFADDGSHEWGLQVQRLVGRTSEQSTWAPWARSSPEIVSHFGVVDGITGLKPSRRLELLPYATAGLALEPVDAGDPVNHHRNGRYGAGLDVKYGLGPAFTLSATINPDFGQVEADPSTINLTANELFFAEKRPFFLEGVDLFKLPIGVGDNSSEGVFYSRRIGAAPAEPDVAYDYLHQPPSTTIYGAAKLTGKTKSGWSVGVFDAVTGQEHAAYSDPDGTHDAIVSPLTNYAMARVKRDLRDGKTTVGVAATAVDRSLAGTPLVSELHDQAYTGSAQVSHRFAHNAWQADLTIVGSYVHGSEEAIARTQQLQRHLFQRPDATHLHFDPHRTSLAGYAVTGSIGQFGDTKHWRYGLGFDARSPGLELNDMGFQRIADHALAFLWMQYRDDDPNDYVLNWQANHDIFAISDFSPELATYGYECNAHVQLLSFWHVNAGCNFNRSPWSFGALRGGPALRGTEDLNGFMNVTSDTRKPVWAQVNANLDYDPIGGGISGGVDLGATIQARPNLDIFLGPSWSSRTDPLQYVSEVDDAVNGTPHYIFGAIDQTTLGMTVRVNWTFSPRLALQAYAQPFIATGRYGEFKDVDNPHAKAFADRFHTFSGREWREQDGTVFVDRNGDGVEEISFSNPNFDFRQMRSTVVLRWEYRPGSNLFAIWSHGQTASDDARLALAHDLSLLARAPAENIVMVKANYWIGL